MSNIHTNFGRLSDEELETVRLNVIDAVRGLSTANGERNIELRRLRNGTVDANIRGIQVDAVQNLLPFMKVVGPEARWLSDDEAGGDQRRIAA